MCRRASMDQARPRDVTSAELDLTFLLMIRSAHKNFVSLRFHLHASLPKSIISLLPENRYNCYTMNSAASIVKPCTLEYSKSDRTFTATISGLFADRVQGETEVYYHPLTKEARRQAVNAVKNSAHALSGDEWKRAAKTNEGRAHVRKEVQSASTASLLRNHTVMSIPNFPLGWHRADLPQVAYLNTFSTDKLPARTYKDRTYRLVIQVEDLHADDWKTSKPTISRNAVTGLTCVDVCQGVSSPTLGETDHTFDPDFRPRMHVLLHKHVKQLRASGKRAKGARLNCGGFAIRVGISRPISMPLFPLRECIGGCSKGLRTRQ